MRPPEIRKVRDTNELSRVGAEEYLRAARDATRQRGIFTVALAGGRTPTGLYELLATHSASELAWDRMHFFWGDERSVPPDHPDSNYRMAREALLSRVGVPAENVHRIATEQGDANRVAANYEQSLREFFHLEEGRLPRFDFVLLGMGADGHTASLFPGTPAVHERSRLVVALWVETLRSYRITLTPPVLNNAATVVFLVAGPDKASALREVLYGEDRPHLYPSQAIQPRNGRLVWIVDREAAALLPC